MWYVLPRGNSSSFKWWLVSYAEICLQKTSCVNPLFTHIHFSLRTPWVRSIRIFIILLIPFFLKCSHLGPVVYYFCWPPGPPLNIKMVFAGMRISMLKIRLSRDSLILNMGIPILVRRHHYIETAPCLREQPTYRSHRVNTSSSAAFIFIDLK